MFPSEILLQIFANLDYRTLASLSVVSRKWKAVAEANILWKHQINHRYKYLYKPSDSDEIDQTKVKWKSIFVARVQKEIEVLRRLDDLVEDSRGRMELIGQIADELGEDVVTVLREVVRAPVEKYSLTHSYYAKKLLSRIRKRAILTFWRTTFHELLRRQEQQRGGAADEILPEPWEVATIITAWTNPFLDRATVDARLQSLADEFLATEALVSNASPPSPAERCLALVRFLVDQKGFRGNTSDYYDVRNSFIDYVIERRTGIPITLSIVLDAVARRCRIQGLELIGYPSHFLARYKGPDGQEFYIDMFRSGQLYTRGECAELLGTLGSGLAMARYLEPITPVSLYQRCLSNIVAAVQRSQSLGSQRPANEHEAVLMGAIYGAMHQMLCLHELPDLWESRAIVFRLMEENWREDTALIRDWILEINADDAARDEMRGIENRLASVADWDAAGEVRAVKRRDVMGEGEGSTVVDGLEVPLRWPYNQRFVPKWRVGHVFRHKKYSYSAVIYGWDHTCEQDDSWIEENGVNNLPQGRHQPFYNAFDDGGTHRYVAEENIELLSPPEPPFVNDELGRYFLRWDADGKAFMPNPDLRKQYPDDYPTSG